MLRCSVAYLRGVAIAARWLHCLHMSQTLKCIKPTPDTDAIRARISAGNFDADDLLRKLEEFERERNEAREAKLGVGKLNTRELWHKVCEANALRAHIDALQKLLPDDTTLELGIQRLQRELAEARNKVVALCNDWADDDSRVKAIALQHGIDVDADAAKDGYFCTVVDVVEAMSAQLDTMRLAIKDACTDFERCKADRGERDKVLIVTSHALAKLQPLITTP